MTLPEQGRQDQMIFCGPFQPEPVCDPLCCCLLLVSGHEDGGFQTPAVFLDILVAFRVGSGRCEWTKDTCTGNLQVLHPCWPSPGGSQALISVDCFFFQYWRRKEEGQELHLPVLPNLQSWISVIGTYLDLR